MESAEPLGLSDKPAGYEPRVSEPLAAFQLSAVGQTFGGRTGIKIERLDISRGRVTAVMGLSGSGKSTLLNLLGGMIEAEYLGGDAKITATICGADGQNATQDVLRS